MPEFRPFHGIRYSSTELKDLVCPPYDVISPEDQALLHDRHPHNAVRLELAYGSGAGGGKYREVGETFSRWLAEGILRTDGQPCFYVYRQDFAGPDGAPHRVAGVIGALKLGEFGAESGVYPHEQTMAGPKADRLDLLRSCPVNISPIYAIYRGEGTLSDLLETLEERPPAAHYADEADVTHRLWVIDAPDETTLITRGIGGRAQVIADGHHRYETALAYHREAGDPGSDSIMCLCVDVDSEQLVVLPYHRALKTALEPQALKERLVALGGKPFEAADPVAMLESSNADHVFVFELVNENVLLEVSDEDATAGKLSVVALHEVVLPRLLGNDPQELTFTRSAHEVERLVRSGGWSAGILVEAVSPRAVVDVAQSGERMPQKASYFWPKAATGLVFRSLR